MSCLLLSGFVRRNAYFISDAHAAETATCIALSLGRKFVTHSRLVSRPPDFVYVTSIV
jgi:hypothetical protein